MRTIKRLIRNAKTYIISHKTTALPIIIGSVILTIVLIAILINNSSSKTDDMATKSATTPTPSKEPSETPTPTDTPTPKVTSKITSTPTPTTKPTTPTPTSGPTSTPTPTPKKDTQPPSYSVIVPPTNSPITESRFCFKVYDFKDNVSPSGEIYFRFTLDGQETDWIQNPEKCYDLSDGQHNAQIKVKDKAENYSTTNSQFTVQKPAATATAAPTSTPTPTTQPPTNTPQPTSAPTPTI